jgi:hypothetical protein
MAAPSVYKSMWLLSTRAASSRGAPSNDSPLGWARSRALSQRHAGGRNEADVSAVPSASVAKSMMVAEGRTAGCRGGGGFTKRRNQICVGSVAVVGEVA